MIRTISTGFAELARALESLLGDLLVLCGYGIIVVLDKAYFLAGRLDAEQAGEHWD